MSFHEGTYTILTMVESSIPKIRDAPVALQSHDSLYPMTKSAIEVLKRYIQAGANHMPA
jgi:uncharacterized pyridoxamine 5'-phosphate oxidase family protein